MRTTVEKYWVNSSFEPFYQSPSLCHGRTRMDVSRIDPGRAKGLRQLANMSQIDAKHEG